MNGLAKDFPLAVYKDTIEVVAQPSKGEREQLRRIEELETLYSFPPHVSSKKVGDRIGSKAAAVSQRASFLASKKNRARGRKCLSTCTSLAISIFSRIGRADFFSHPESS